ncbi:MAG: nucleotidyltransferase domain-containing protein [Elusimicrobia bacterium]|nr:nucleotidyltransferase domain-containing protein [Elusimicrobiota bacterium]
MSIPSPRSKKPDMAAIKRAALAIAQKLRPKKIILFGSYAYGKPGLDSDVDFFIVKDGKRKSREYAMIADMALVPRPFPVDIVVRSSKDVKERPPLGDFFLQDIVNKGITLYEKPGR